MWRMLRYQAKWGGILNTVGILSNYNGLKGTVPRDFLLQLFS
jgi:hypothetical protein